jgi:hypothetical protein
MWSSVLMMSMVWREQFIAAKIILVVTLWMVTDR